MRARGCEQRDDRLRSIPFRSVGCHGRPGSRPASPWHSQTGNPTGANRILTTEHMAPVVSEFAKASQSSLPLETQRESAAMDKTGETPDLVRTICRSSSVRAVHINFKRRCPAVNKSTVRVSVRGTEKRKRAEASERSRAHRPGAFRRQSTRLVGPRMPLLTVWWDTDIWV